MQTIKFAKSDLMRYETSAIRESPTFVQSRIEYPLPDGTKLVLGASRWDRIPVTAGVFEACGHWWRIDESFIVDGPHIKEYVAIELI